MSVKYLFIRINLGNDNKNSQVNLNKSLTNTINNFVSVFNMVYKTVLLLFSALFGYCGTMKNDYHLQLPLCPILPFRCCLTLVLRQQQDEEADCTLITNVAYVLNNPTHRRWKPTTGSMLYSMFLSLPTFHNILHHSVHFESTSNVVRHDIMSSQLHSGVSGQKTQVRPCYLADKFWPTVLYTSWELCWHAAHACQIIVTMTK